MIPETAWSLVPEQVPPETERWITNSADAAKLGNRERRSYAWANHLLSRTSQSAISTAVLGLLPPTAWDEYSISEISAGFIPFLPGNTDIGRTPRQERMDNEERVVTGDVNYSFGVVIGVLSSSDTDQVRGGASGLSQVVSIDGFPVVAEYRRLSDNAPPHPHGVVSTCYARPRSSKRFYGPSWADGIVVARHVLAGRGFSVGTSVPMASGSALSVVDIDGATTIDAAVLDCASIPVGVSPLSLAPAIAPGSNVDVRTATKTFAAQALRIYDHPTYFGNMMSHRVFIDSVGVPGDSGSLVTRSVPHSDAVGVYIGSTGGGLPEGVVQSLRQVVQYFDIDLFD